MVVVVNCITIRLSYPTLLLCAVLNTNMVKIKYARPKILAGHLVGSHSLGITALHYLEAGRRGKGICRANVKLLGPTYAPADVGPTTLALHHSVSRTGRWNLERGRHAIRRRVRRLFARWRRGFSQRSSSADRAIH